MWFLVCSVLFFNSIAYLIPKRLTKGEMYTTSLFALVFELIVDIFFDLKYNLYGYFNPGVDFATLIAIFGLYPAGSVIFLNHYPYGKTVQAISYISAWTVFIVVFEILSVQSGYFYYNGWKLWYSVVMYIVVFYVLAQNLSFFRKLNADRIKNG